MSGPKPQVRYDLKKKAFLAERTAKIKEALRVNGPYTHNIVTLALQAVMKEYGKVESDKLFDSLKLDKKGYTK